MAPMPNRTARLLRVWGLALALSYAAPAAAAAHVPTTAAVGQATAPARAVATTLGSKAAQRPDGLYAVEGIGSSEMISHGPDMLREMAGPGVVQGFASGDPERAPVCATDHYQHVIYARPAGSTDRFAEVKPEIQAAVRRMNAVLNASSLASGGGTADFKLLCDEQGDVRVDEIVVPDASVGSVVEALESAGLQTAGANYTVFVDDDAGGACGVASYSNDERLAADNAANLGGGFALIYERCWFTEGPMHETAHNLGAVAYGAPHSTGTGGHCNEELDVLCYSPDGGDLNQESLVNRCSNRIQFDCGADDYFDTAPEPGEYLADHWNLGSTLNQFMVFGDRPPDATRQPLRLQRDKPRRDTSAGLGTTREFWVRVRPHTRQLVIELRAPAGPDLDLYVGSSPGPDEEGYVCRSTGATAVERCVINRPATGRWYAGVPTVAGDAGAPFKVKAVN